MSESLEILLRTLLFLTLLFFFTKWLGKKQLAQLSIFQYVTGIVLGSVVAFYSIDLQANISHGLIVIFTWFILPFILELLTLKSKRARNFIKGESVVLIKDGKVLEDNLKKERYSADDLLQSLRNKDVFRAADVEFAVLETSGQLNVLKKKAHQVPTVKDLKIRHVEATVPQTVIMDGEIINESLAQLALNPSWLHTELEKMNVTLANVFLGQVDGDGQLSIDLYDDKLTVPQAQEKPLLLASLKKCQADLELFALATENKRSKQLYDSESKKVTQAIDLVKPYLQA